MKNLKNRLVRSDYLTRIIIAFMVVFVLSASVSAEKATVEEMDRVCRNWMTMIVHQEGSWNGSPDPKVDSFADIVTEGEIAGRIFNIVPSGFIVVPILKEMPVVSFYSTETNLDIKDSEGIADVVRTVLGHRVKVFREFYGNLESGLNKSGDNIFGPEDRAMWNDFTASDETFVGTLGELTKDSRGVGPYLTTSWHQGYPYNNYCPMGDGGRCIAGCVATAAAQIMWYHQWPPFGSGSHSYYWDGDYCTGAGGGYLSADFWDAYDYTVNNYNVAEISYEAGVAYDMGYGNCASGAYLSGTPTIFSTYFRYSDNIERRNRFQYTAAQWFTMIQTDLDAGLPILYGITQHAIVCDGWKSEGGIDQYHMNYGWGGSQNYWYVLDDYYCPVASCSVYDEQMYIGMAPDKDIMIYSDVNIGPAPLSVNFSGYSDLIVDTWDWTFGDGDIGTGQYPLHEYPDPGIYSVDLEIDAGGNISSISAQDFVIVTADTIKAPDIETAVDDTITVTFNVQNIAPLRTIRIPIEYSGDVGLKLLGYSTEGCRTDYFEIKQEVKDPWNKTATYTLTCSYYGTEPHLAPGNGPVLEVTFEVLSGSPNDITTIILDGYSSYFPTFSSFYGDYTPELIFPEVSIAMICGDVNGDQMVNVLDIVYLIDWKFKNGPDPDPMEAANVNGDELVNLLDIIYLIDYKFKNGPEPNCP